MTTFREVARSAPESAGHRLLDAEVPTVLRLGDSPVPDRLPPLPFSVARRAEVPRAEAFRDGAEAAVGCARPAGPGSYSREDARHVQDIRRFTTSCLRRWGVEEDVVEAAELIASELYTSELMHGTDEVIRVQLIAGSSTFTVAVAGGGPYVPVYPMVEPDDQGRRGLFLVDHLARVHRGYWGLSADGTAWCLLASAGLRAAA
ncbi:ATP-binding protein [Streptomyces sp. PCS3-D2]|uniref:ATP-binding protein n=1 Tax=Streptomyces sp. PCS3-D2 TaxID=1460244 RepID=UPI0012FF4CF7|nr:ATP-binding protein [Streptomyces sp. PCS3-D2]WKV74140.1 ATP-binding protein [Streptomyces sp. PCS3-D2]